MMKRNIGKISLLDLLCMDMVVFTALPYRIHFIQLYLKVDKINASVQDMTSPLCKTCNTVSLAI